MSSPAKTVYVIVTSFFLVAFAIPLVGLGQKGDLHQFLERVDQKLSSVRSLAASFEQTREIGLTDQTISAKGRLYLQKPGRILLDYVSPERHKLLVHDSVVMIYLPSLKQVQRFSFEGTPEGKNLFVFWESLEDLKREFTVSAGRGRGDRLRYVEFVPKDEAGAEGFRRLVLGIDPELGLPQVIEVEEVGGDVVKMTLSRIKVNPELKESLFELDLGDEIEIIDYRGDSESVLEQMQ
ncbi:MAG: outer membrane lipoprotein carrier protein LolA [Candidatus Eiseniibacteriota bacterium]|nr:MAG: outer membrane lipoprotein carrier protein LolA [Candidatus Eisenbacteria bacterium]